MGYRLSAWDGDFRTKDFFTASGRLHRTGIAQKAEAVKAAKAYLATYAPKGEGGHVYLEKTSSRFRPEMVQSWTVDRLSAAPWYRWRSEK